MNKRPTQIVRLVVAWVLAVCSLPRVAVAEDDKPDLPSIEKKSLELLQRHLPQPTKAGEINLPDQTKITYGPLFDEGMVALVNFFPRPINDSEFDYPPCFLSLARYSKKSWHFVQYLGSASRYELCERRDLKLKVVQGSCYESRNEGDYSSWRWDSKRQRLVPTGLDNWGPYSIVGGFIVYRRGIERLAHWDTRWIYRYEWGKRGEFVGCFHEEDSGRWTISFRLNPDDKELTSWSFQPDLEHPENVTVSAVTDEEAFQGKEIAQLKLAKGEYLGQGFCFGVLTGLSAQLLEDTWHEKLRPVSLKSRPEVEATGDSEVIARFQWPLKK